jgi:hypothetical protein
MKLKQYKAQHVRLKCQQCGVIHERHDGRHMSLYALQHIRDEHCDGKDIEWVHENALRLVAEYCYMERIVAWELVE